MGNSMPVNASSRKGADGFHVDTLYVSRSPENIPISCRISQMESLARVND